MQKSNSLSLHFMHKPLFLLFDIGQFMMVWQVVVIGIWLLGAYVLYLMIRALRKYLRQDKSRIN
jgi:uncharacterized membrane protein YdfJ with MMPL/SSD domain